MNDYKNFCEYSVRPKPGAGNIAARVILMTLYTLFIAIYVIIFWINFKSWALLIMLPFIMYAVIRMTWKLVDIEYEYIIEAGELSVACIYGGASRRVKQRVYIPDMLLITPEDQAGNTLNGPDIEKVVDYSTDETAVVCICPTKNGRKKLALVIDTTDEMRRILRLCNPSACSFR